MADTSPDRPLTPKQERFCQAYTTHWNATRAAKEAGYSEQSAMFQGYQLLQIPLVQKRIKELKDHALAELGITRERILQEYSHLAFADVSQAYDEMGQFKPLSEIPEDVRRSLKEIEVHELFDGQGEQRSVIGLAKKAKFQDKTAALAALTKVLGMAPDKIEHSGPGGKPIETLSRSDMSDEQLDARIAGLVAKLAPKPECGAV